ncbi:hypothetical protein YC2023_091281 [Brassica napus]
MKLACSKYETNPFKLVFRLRVINYYRYHAPPRPYGEIKSSRTSTIRDTNERYNTQRDGKETNSSRIHSYNSLRCSHCNNRNKLGIAKPEQKLASGRLTLKKVGPNQVVVDNGIIQVTFSSPQGLITGIKYKGFDNVLNNKIKNRGYAKP